MPPKTIKLKKLEGGKNGRWWDLITKKTKKKWKKLQHNGPLFPKSYQPLPNSIKITHKGNILNLDKTNTKNRFNVTAEEAAMFYAQSLETNDRTLSEGKKQKHDDIRKDKKFKQNFLDDWKEILGKDGKSIKSLDDIDFTPMIDYIVATREKKKEIQKNKTKSEKALEKLEKEKIKDIFGFAVFDNVLLPVTSNIEPPSIFKGHGKSADRGKIKGRIIPRDITLNISHDSIPECILNGNKCKWGKIVTNKNASWLSTWKNPINKKPVYTRINRNFDPWVGRNDYQKFEKARDLNSKINKIRKNYIKDLKDPSKTEFALAVYLLDKIAIRPGTEKGDEGTRGLTTLKCENIKWNDNKHTIRINFIGKSSIQFNKKIKLDDYIYALLRNNCSGKKSSPLFPHVNAKTLNEYLGSLSKGLTAKVFRTWKASSEVDKQLQKIKLKKNADLQEKKVAFFNANIKAALELNHKRMTDNTEKVQKILDKIKKLTKELENSKTPTQKRNKRNAISTAKLKLNEAENNVNMGTSKANYIDPRIIVSWAKSHDVPIEAIYKTANDRKRFIWAMEIPSTWEFNKSSKKTKTKNNKDIEIIDKFCKDGKTNNLENLSLKSLKLFIRMSVEALKYSNANHNLASKLLKYHNLDDKGKKISKIKLDDNSIEKKLIDYMKLGLTPSGKLSKIPIRFFSSAKDPWYKLSNLYKCKCTIGKFTFPSAEHAYQALQKIPKENMEPWLEGGKFSDWEYVYKILGKPYNKKKQNKWQKKNQIGILAIMVIRNFEKFGINLKKRDDKLSISYEKRWKPIFEAKYSNKSLRDILISTGSQPLIEFKRGGHKTLLKNFEKYLDSIKSNEKSNEKAQMSEIWGAFNYERTIKRKGKILQVPDILKMTFWGHNITGKNLEKFRNSII
jgi:DNA topoisomerase-1